MSALSDQELYNLLLDNQYLEKEDLERSVATSKLEKISLHEAVVRLDLLADSNLGKLEADFLKVPFIDLGTVSIPDEVLRIVPMKLAQKEQVIAFEYGSKGLKVAMVDPTHAELLDFLSWKVGDEIRVYLTTERGLVDSLRLYKIGLDRTFKDILKEEVDQAGKSVVKEAPIAKIVDVVIEYAYDSKASDIHIEPQEDRSLIRFRIDGILHDEIELPLNLHDQVVTRIKVLSKLRTDEHLGAQDGKLQVKLPMEELDVRVSIVPIVEGEKVVLRLLTSHFRSFGLSDLGMSDRDLEKVQTSFHRPFGMILATGPTGSGKTTSMYAILKILNTREKNIATIEDPVEYDIGGLNQIQVNPKTNLTFAEGLRSILRQDPDIIYVGEIRDEETADIAINSAMTGHLVLSTLHTNDAATALPRLLDMNIEPFLVASTVNVIIAQRLVRKICDQCKVSFTTDMRELEKHVSRKVLEKYFGKIRKVRMYKGQGCNICHKTGYTGRVGIFEVLVVSETIQSLIDNKSDAAVIEQQAIKEGMTMMIEDGVDKVERGVTTMEEVLRATKE